jgi:hexosaminidase
MKKVLFFMLLLAITRVYGQNSTIHLIPQPVEIKQSNGSFLLTKGTTIGYNKADAQKTAEMLVQKLNLATGMGFKTQLNNISNIQLNLTEANNPKIGNEGYTLVSGEKGVVITANQPAGLFYGIQTLLQLFPKEVESKTITKANWAIPAVNITDYPRFAWRGLMLDVSRHFFNKEDVKTYIDEMSRFKLNTLHWHLTDDEGWRIEIKSLPKLTQVGAWRVPRIGRFGEFPAPKPGEAATDGGFYTQDDIREIVKYAQERHITILPEIDVPGHSMAAIASYPELSCKKDTTTKVNPGTNFAEWYGNGTFKMFVENALNPSNEKVYDFLDKVFTEVATLFPCSYVHVGGDECYKGFWAQDPGCQELMKKLQIRHVEDLQGYFMNRVEGILKAKGKKLIGWDEILEGGISPEATVMSWRGIKGGIEAAKMGHDVVMTPTTFAYIDYCQGDPSVDPPIYATLRLKKTYSYEPIPEDVDPKYILGGQANLWTEKVPTLRYAEYMTYPRGWAISEVFWSARESKNWEKFVPRVEAQFERSEIAETGYSKAIYDAIIQPYIKDKKLWLQMEPEIPGLDIYYSIDGTMPDQYSTKFSKPVELPEGPLTLRVITYRNNKPIGHLITLTLEELKNRAGN